MGTDHRISRRLAPVAAHRITALGVAGFAFFLVLTIAVQARLLASLDLPVASATRGLVSAPLDTFAAALSIVFSGELSLLGALAASLFLWKRGLGRWSLAPLAFLLLVLIEFGLKASIDQPPVPSDFHRSVYYPLTNVRLNGSFPSGHAIRSGFICAFLAVLLAPHHGKMARAAALGVTLLALLGGFTRIYLGYHWLSDVAAGLILGAALALIVAPPVARRLAVPGLAAATDPLTGSAERTQS